MDEKLTRKLWQREQKTEFKLQLVSACECHPLGTDTGTNVIYLHVLLIFIMFPDIFINK